MPPLKSTRRNCHSQPVQSRLSDIHRQIQGEEIGKYPRKSPQQSMSSWAESVVFIYFHRGSKYSTRSLAAISQAKPSPFKSCMYLVVSVVSPPSCRYVRVSCTVSMQILCAYKFSLSRATTTTTLGEFQWLSVCTLTRSVVLSVVWRGVALRCLRANQKIRSSNNYELKRILLEFSRWQE